MGIAVGITGGIASGKSTVAQIIAQEGFSVLSADQIAREVVAPQTVGWQRLRTTFGQQFFDSQGNLLRSELGTYVFENSQALKKLNEITQPLIRQRIQEIIVQARSGLQPLFLEIPLLFEQSYQGLLDQIIVVEVTPAVQIQRLRQRDRLSSTAAQAKIAAQWSNAQRRAQASYIITNNGNYAMLSKQVIQILNQLNDEE
ncbi:dephospho-CoA kinase [Lactobacillus sp. DCY120]|uniref:Dephospho-CoA kinase n=1 Tax=Bombilactobacillus apium TaxID=2675299 RepID=A0A850R3E9_9LACO|nr:dephospho-CoA kinase [Bombilactobacillus apium]NVY96890.1 dephospho-CoA kinase [Bombilactobacillus apium]